MSSLPASDAPVLEFYRLRVRIQRGARVRTRDLAAAYEAWASERGYAGASYRQIGRVMRHHGHRHFHSDGAWYAGAVVMDADQEPAAAPAVGDLKAIEHHAMMVRLDSLSAELAALRQRLAERAP